MSPRPTSDRNFPGLELRALEALGDALILLSQQGRIVGWTGRAQAMFGHRPQEIVGHSLDRLLPAGDAPQVFEQAKRSLRVESATTLKHRDGRNLSVVLTLTPLKNSHGQRVGLVCLAKDLGPWLRLQAPQAQGGAAESVVLASFHDITTRLARSLDPDETLSAITRAITNLIDADIGAVGLLDEERGTIRPLTSHGHRTRDFPDMVQPRDQGISWRAVRTGRVQRVADYWKLPEAARVDNPAITSEPLRSVMVAPLTARGRSLGVIGAYRRRVDPFDERAAFLLSMLADHASLALDNALTYSELARARHRVEALLASTEAIWRPLPVTEMAAVVAEQAQQLLPGVECLVWLPPHPGWERLRVAGAAGPWAVAQLGKEAPVAGTSLERVMVERRAISSDGGEPGDALRHALARAGLKSVRLVPLGTGEPLLDGRGSLGVLGFYRSRSDSYTAEESQLMDEFGKRVSLALHRVELLEEAQRTAQRLQTAIEIAVDLSASLDPGEVIRRILGRAAAAVEADRASLLSIDGQDVVVEGVFDTDDVGDVTGLRHSVRSQPLIHKAIQLRRPVLGPRYSLQPIPPSRRAPLAAVRHTATIPLLLESKVVALLLLSRRGPKAFGPDDLATLELVGNQAVLALRNARLFAQAQEAGYAKSEFLNMAAHELRTPLSVVSGYLSMLNDGSFGPIPAHWQYPLDTLTTKAAELGRLIEDLLLASRLEAGAVPMGNRPLDLRRAVKDAIGRALPRATVLGSELAQRLPRSSVLVEADPEHLGRILDNLINNAMSYSRDQPVIRITVSGRGSARVAVEDRGQGIAPELRERIFERFFRIEDPDLQHQAGTGLGLYISRDLAVRLGGSLRLEWSEVGKGSRFVLTLPLAGPGDKVEVP